MPVDRYTMQLYLGTSGWSYNDTSDKGGWVGPFYPNKSIKKLPYYSQYFNTAEHDATYYEKLYKFMKQATFEGMAKTTPDNFQVSIKVPETITRAKKLNPDSVALLAEFLDKISPLKKANKLGALLFQMSPNFIVDDFRNAESFLEGLPRGYDYALEFRHASWHTEGALELLHHYNIASVMTDSPDPKLQYLSDFAVTADHAFIRLHGRNKGFWYNYLYSKEELQPWADKVKKLAKDPKVKVLRIYFNNHYGAKAIVNALQFKELTGKLTEQDKRALEKAELQLSGKVGLDKFYG